MTFAYAEVTADVVSVKAAEGEKYTFGPGSKVEGLSPERSKHMRYAWRTLLIVAVFLGVGYWVMHLVILHSVEMSAPDSEIRLAAGMAGLFSGGAAACLVAIVTLWGRPPA